MPNLELSTEPGQLHGTDIDLLVDVIEARNLLASEVLDDVLGADNLAGRMGEELVQRNQRFRGIAGKEARERQISLLMNNTDLVVMPHRYGMCFYRRDVAKCQGERKKIGVNTCIGCKNFVVAERHLGYWRDRRSQLAEFKSQLQDVYRSEALENEISEATEVINLIEGVHSVR